MTYSEWIDQKYPDGDGHGECKAATGFMIKEFPDLRRVRGHYYCPGWNEQREHWWCVDQSGNIVDPTASQFPSRGHGTYTEWDGSKAEPTGKCPECGAYCFDGKMFCCDGCDSSYMAYMNGAPL